MRISLEHKPTVKRRSIFTLFLFAVFYTTLIFIALGVLLASIDTQEDEMKKTNEIAEKDEEEEEEQFEMISESKKEEVLEKIQEEIPKLPKKDVAVLEGYTKEVNEYTDAVLFFMRFMNTTFSLAFNDFENRNSFLFIAEEHANLCIEYMGDKSIVPKQILETIEGSERVAVDYCKSAKKHSSLIRSYLDETEAEEMVILLTELREHYESVEVKAYVLNRICKDLEDAVL